MERTAMDGMADVQSCGSLSLTLSLPLSVHCRDTPNINVTYFYDTQPNLTMNYTKMGLWDLGNVYLVSVGLGWSVGPRWWRYCVGLASGNLVVDIQRLYIYSAWSLALMMAPDCRTCCDHLPPPPPTHLG